MLITAQGSLLALTSVWACVLGKAQGRAPAHLHPLPLLEKENYPIFVCHFLYGEKTPCEGRHNIPKCEEALLPG